MDGWEVLLVGLTALGTSAISAVLGFGGGVVLLALMLVFLDPLVAIPLHAAIQIASNGTRTVIRRHDVDWGIVARSSLLLLPAGALTVPLARAAPEGVLQVAIAVTVLATTWIPERTTLEVPAPSPTAWIGIGAVVGALNPLVGATGPLFAPLFRAATTTRQRFVGTFAGTAVTGHLAKLVLFGAAGLAPTGRVPVVVAGIAGVVVGTELGSRALDRIDDARFRQMYLVAITAVAAHLLVDAVVGVG
jgi:uncharacterized membrane protein YfcA